jgi:hypothetical protein
MFKSKVRKILDAIVIRYLTGIGFAHYWKHFVHGPKERLQWEFSERDLSIDAVFNTRSGFIRIGDGTVIGHGCMFLTGRHEFENGVLIKPKKMQVPSSGYDITVGSGSWIASGAIVIGGVSLGEHCLVCAGAVVTKSFPAYAVIGGVPAKQIGDTRKLLKTPRPSGEDREDTEMSL